MNRDTLERRAARWNRQRRANAQLIALAVGLVTAAAVVRTSLVGAIGAAWVSALVAWWVMRRRTTRVTPEMIAAHLDRSCPTLEESASLWLRDASQLSLVEALQLKRLEAAWAELPDREDVGGPPRGGLRWSIAGCALAATAVAVLVLITPPNPSPSSIKSAEPAMAMAVSRAPLPAVLVEATIHVQPPEYLAQAAWRIDGLDGEVPEGATLTWTITLNGDASGISLEGLEAKIEKISEGRFRADVILSATRFYRLAITPHDGSRIVWPQLHTLKATRDLPPRVTWQEPAMARTTLDPARGRPMVNVRLAAVDDHGIADAKLVMTVAKGSGDSMKFRERELVLDRGSVLADGSLPLTCVLDLVALGLEPGDEIYFHALVTDRRKPVNNLTRSETRFVVLGGPSTEVAEPGVAFAGVNRVPQYFRSQRQLIIDTERLVADQPTMNDVTFRERSEEIGIDQKLLRLRYGQFLGEEFEPTSIGAPKEAQGIAFAAQVRGQDRTAANRAAAIDRAVEAQHDHPVVPPNDGRPKTAAEIAAPFTHLHDNAEAATLFDLQVKTSLRAVLAAMWEAEGFLRSGRPAEALPAENRALQLLKDLQEADRVYVKRVGFDSAPLKIEERRLRGELETIPKRVQVAAPVPPRNAAEEVIRAVLRGMGARSEVVDVGDSALVDERLTRAAQEQPEIFALALEVWRRRAAGLSETDQATLRTALWSLLPATDEMPRSDADGATTLGLKYRDALNTNQEIGR
jgi:hypothetical protein